MSVELNPLEPNRPLPPNPQTGELLELATAPTADLAAWLDAVRWMEGEQRDAKRQVQAEIIKRMDTDASYTLREGDYELSGDSPKPVEVFDVEPLAADLDDLVAEGIISADARARVIVETVERKVALREIRKLMNLGGVVASVVERHRTEAPRERRVRVKRNRP